MATGTPTGLTGKLTPCFMPSHQGLVLSVGLTVAAGAQNAFVLRQGLRRGHVGSVVHICALAGAALITARVLGMPQALLVGQSLQIA